MERERNWWRCTATSLTRAIESLPKKCCQLLRDGLQMERWNFGPRRRERTWRDALSNCPHSAEFEHRLKLPKHSSTTKLMFLDVFWVGFLKLKTSNFSNSPWWCSFGAVFGAPLAHSQVARSARSEIWTRSTPQSNSAEMLLGCGIKWLQLLVGLKQHPLQTSKWPLDLVRSSKVSQSCAPSGSCCFFFCKKRLL